MYEETDDLRYDVVINDEGQYSIWPAHLPCPSGWEKAGVSGDKKTCLDYIDRTWLDMRPRSLREQMAAAAAEQA